MSARRIHFWTNMASLICAATVFGSFLTLTVRAVYAQYQQPVRKVVVDDNQDAINQKFADRSDMLDYKLSRDQEDIRDLKADVAKCQDKINDLSHDTSTFTNIAGGGTGLVILFQIFGIAAQRRGAKPHLSVEMAEENT